MNRTGELTEEEVNRKTALRERLGSNGANVLTLNGGLIYSKDELSEINELAESKNALTTANANLT
jgi:hypothetical protein